MKPAFVALQYSEHVDRAQQVVLDQAGGCWSGRRRRPARWGWRRASMIQSTAGSASRSLDSANVAVEELHAEAAAVAAGSFRCRPGRGCRGRNVQAQPRVGRPGRGCCPTKPQMPVTRSLHTCASVQEALGSRQRWFQVLGDVPARVMRLHLAQVADSSRCGRRRGSGPRIHALHRLAGDGLGQLERFQDGTGCSPVPPPRL